MRHWEDGPRTEPLSLPDSEHLELIRQGTEVWNKWRKENPKIKPNLTGVDLKGLDLSGINLSGTQLTGAKMTGCILTRANLSKACLREAILYEANLDNANLNWADLVDADLLMTSISGAILSNVNAHGARFSGAIIKEAQLSGADLRQTDLKESEIHNTDLRRVQFDGAILWTTQLQESDLRGAVGMRFDETIIRDTKFSPRSPDRWSTLRRHYTGPRYAVTLILLVFFILPYFGKAAGWVAASHSQAALSVALEGAQNRIDAINDSTATGRVVLNQALQGVREKLPGPQGTNWRDVRVWELLLGVDKGPWYFATTLMILLYNLLRGLLTWVVAPMRDAEERSGVSPPHRVQGATRLAKLTAWLSGGWAETYAWLWIPHQAVGLLFAVAVASFLFHALNWLTLVVWLPA